MKPFEPCNHKRLRIFFAVWNSMVGGNWGLHGLTHQNWRRRYACMPGAKLLLQAMHASSDLTDWMKFRSPIHISIRWTWGDHTRPYISRYHQRFLWLTLFYRTKVLSEHLVPFSIVSSVWRWNWKFVLICTHDINERTEDAECFNGTLETPFRAWPIHGVFCVRQSNIIAQIRGMI